MDKCEGLHEANASHRYTLTPDHFKFRDPEAFSLVLLLALKAFVAEKDLLRGLVSTWHF